MASRRLTRSETDRLIGGVCGGLAEYLQVDATLVRLGFVAVTALGGAGVVAYVVLWLLVPRASHADAPPRDVVRDNVAEGRRFAEDTARAAREAVQRVRDGSGASSGEGPGWDNGASSGEGPGWDNPTGDEPGWDKPTDDGPAWDNPSEPTAQDPTEPTAQDPTGPAAQDPTAADGSPVDEDPAGGPPPRDTPPPG